LSGAVLFPFFIPPLSKIFIKNVSFLALFGAEITRKGVKTGDFATPLTGYGFNGTIGVKA
jgi:hypothetical protein